MGRIKALGKIEDGGRITIPGEMLQSLGLKKDDHVGFALEDGELRIIKGSITELTAGLLHTPGVSFTIEEMKEAAEIAIAEEATRRGGS
jgi:bifunctional DNA-binding transcriptional regulator/antitoxin component of YhaV-PrlF toxin-antitoxin module